MQLPISHLFRSALIFGFLAPFYSEHILKANAQSELEVVSMACVHAGSRKACTDAIILTDSLQLRAEARGFFSCQTRLLGLGNTLTMRMLNPSTSDFVLTALKEVNLFCKNL